jgi:hypothetical protein
MNPSVAESPPSQSVVERIAEAENTDPVNLDTPLYDAIDPDALDALFSPVDEARSLPGQVTFSYYGYTVTVDSSGDVALAEDPAHGEAPGVAQD